MVDHQSPLKIRILFEIFALLTSNFAQFGEEVQNGPSESAQYELVARRYADTPLRRYADTNSHIRPVKDNFPRLSAPHQGKSFFEFCV